MFQTMLLVQIFYYVRSTIGKVIVRIGTQSAKELECCVKDFSKQESGDVKEAELV